MCGGRSTRMGKDKAFLRYFFEPQYAHTANLIKPFCNNVFISCNNQQSYLIEDFPLIIDNPAYENKGPLTGLISGLQTTQSNLLLVGCDYPYLSPDDIADLFFHLTENAEAVCFYHENEGLFEPTIGIYKLTILPKLLSFTEQGESSLQKFLQSIVTKKVTPKNALNIKSIDTPVQSN